MSAFDALDEENSDVVDGMFGDTYRVIPMRMATMQWAADTSRTAFNVTAYRIEGAPDMRSMMGDRRPGSSQGQVDGQIERITFDRRKITAASGFLPRAGDQIELIGADPPRRWRVGVGKPEGAARVSYNVSVL